MRPRQVRKQIRRAMRYQAYSEVLAEIERIRATPPYAAGSDQCIGWMQAINSARNMVLRARAYAGAGAHVKFGPRRDGADELVQPQNGYLAG